MRQSVQIGLAQQHQPDLGVRPVGLKNAIHHGRLLRQRTRHIPPIVRGNLEGLVDQIRARKCGQQKEQRGDHFVKMDTMDHSMAQTHQAWPS